MDVLFEYFVIGVVATCVFLAILPASTWLANRIGLVDHPSGRKQHDQSTPLTGGITIFIAFLLVSVATSNGQFSWSMFLWFSLVLILGVFDDLYDISQRFRLVAHALIVVGIARTDGHLVFSIGAIIDPSSAVYFPYPVAVLFSVIAVVGAINSVNMIDGIDGLLGSMVLITLVALLLAGAGNVKGIFSNSVFTVLIGAVFGFLIMNSRFFGQRMAKVFMGDAGSTAIGFILVYLMISSSQGSDAVISPVVAGWLLGLPLLDTSAVIVMRVLSGKSVIDAGRDHLHHILLRRINSSTKVVALMAVMHLCMISIGLLGPKLIGQSSDLILFWLFVALVPLRCLATYKFDPELAIKAQNNSSSLFRN